MDQFSTERLEIIKDRIAFLRHTIRVSNLKMGKRNWHLAHTYNPQAIMNAIGNLQSELIALELEYDAINDFHGTQDRV